MSATRAWLRQERARRLDSTVDEGRALAAIRRAAAIACGLPAGSLWRLDFGTPSAAEERVAAAVEGACR
jgi:hypothetical protein